jgi:hypothetical protein
MASFIKLTQLDGLKKLPVQVSVDQICWVGMPFGGDAKYNAAVKCATEYSM